MTTTHEPFKFDIVNKKECPFCGKEMIVKCICGAYAVTEETYHLPVDKQPYATKER